MCYFWSNNGNVFIANNNIFSYNIIRSGHALTLHVWCSLLHFLRFHCHVQISWLLLVACRWSEINTVQHVSTRVEYQGWYVIPIFICDTNTHGFLYSLVVVCEYSSIPFLFLSTQFSSSAHTKKNNNWRIDIARLVILYWHCSSTIPSLKSYAVLYPIGSEIWCFYTPQM